jgi:hypothetical protein
MGCYLATYCKTTSHKNAYRTNDLRASIIERSIKKLPVDTKVLDIFLEGMIDLPIAGEFINSTNSFVEMKIIPDDFIFKNQVQQSTIKPSDLNPVWDPPEKFTIVASKFNASRILMSVYHVSSNNTRNPVPIGDAVLKLKDLELTTLADQEPQKRILSLTSPNSGKAAGSIKLSIVCKSLEDAVQNEVQHAWEFQRWNLTCEVRWGNTLRNRNAIPAHFLATDPGRWCTYDGSLFGRELRKVTAPLKPGWVLTEDWYTQSTGGDVDGWMYSTGFNSPYWYPAMSNPTYVLRRRLWTRKIKNSALYSATSISSNEDNFFSRVSFSSKPKEVEEVKSADNDVKKVMDNPIKADAVS